MNNSRGELLFIDKNRSTSIIQSARITFTVCFQCCSWINRGSRGGEGTHSVVLSSFSQRYADGRGSHPPCLPAYDMTDDLPGCHAITLLACSPTGRDGTPADSASTKIHESMYPNGHTHTHTQTHTQTPAHRLTDTHKHIHCSSDFPYTLLT